MHVENEYSDDDCQNEEKPERGIETTCILPIKVLHLCRQNEEKPERGIETSMACRATSISPVSQNEEKPERGIETPLLISGLPDRRHSQNEEKPERGIETHDAFPLRAALFSVRTRKSPSAGLQLRCVL